MGLFGKKNKEEVKEEVPLLPRLPKLPELPKIEEIEGGFPTLPNYPYPEKFSQKIPEENIPEKREGELFEDNGPIQKSQEIQVMPRPLKKPITQESPLIEEEEKPEVEYSPTPIIRKPEPVFIRIDKFEESLRVFERAKKQIPEIERIILHIKKIKEEEHLELEKWENEIQQTKKQIEKIDKDIFSKIE